MSKEAAFNLFRQRAQELLSVPESQQVKEALSEFLKKKSVEGLVASLSAPLNTQEKRKVLFPLIQPLIPVKYQSDFEDITKDLPPPPPPKNSTGFSESQIQQMEEESSMYLDILKLREEKRVSDHSNPFMEHEESDDFSDDVEGMHAFDLAISLAQLELKLGGPGSYIQATTNDMYDQPADTEGLKKSGFRSASFKNRPIHYDPKNPKLTPTSSAPPRRGLPAGAILEDEPDGRRGLPSGAILDEDELAQHSFKRGLPMGAILDDDELAKHSFKRGLPMGAMLSEEDMNDIDHDYMADCATREDAELMLIEGGKSEGLFLVRKKALGSGSIKLKPGQRPPHRTFVLTLVQDGKFVHLLLEQQNKGDVFTVSSKSFGEERTLHGLMKFLKNGANYPLLKSPFHCQHWYHGDITREEAEKRVYKVPRDGHFLVRKSTREPNTFVISLFLAGHVHHNKLVCEGGRWSATSVPGVSHNSLEDLVYYHRFKANGMQHALAHPCERPHILTREDLM